jgi:hypothetical protein
MSESTFLESASSVYIHAELINAQQGNVALLTLPVLKQQTQRIVAWIPYLAICILSNSGFAKTTDVAS